MLQIDLSQLRRTRTVTVKAAIAPESDVWTDSELRFSGAVDVSALATLTAEGGVVVRGSWRAPVHYDCGRCLRELDVAIERPLTLVYVSGEEWVAGDPDVRSMGHLHSVLDLKEAIREEVLLEVPRYHCPDDEAGSCTVCRDPVERFRYAAEEPREGIDPRWSALKALQTE